jgi:polar amino acid transport system permease protein
LISPNQQPWQLSALAQEREVYRRSRRRRSWLIALVSSAVVIGAVLTLIGTSSGWPRTRDSFFDLRTGWADLPAQLRALWLNIQIMLVSEVCVLVLAGLLAFVRTLRAPIYFPLRAIATAYTDLFRGVPLLIVLYVVGFGLPSLRLQGLPTSPFTLCIIALTLTYSAYVAEVFRAGIESVHPSQLASARALGLSHGQAMRYVIFPQAVRRVMPPLTLGVIELVLTAQNEQSQDFKFVHYLVAGAIFVILTVPLTRFTDWIARRQGWINPGAIL